MIRKAEVPVIPVYFHGHNSRSFHMFGKVHPALRTLRIPAEFLKKQNSTIQMGIGERIEWAELADLENEAIRDLLRRKTYEQAIKFRR
jgi:putative hemolysin